MKQILCFQRLVLLNTAWCLLNIRNTSQCQTDKLLELYSYPVSGFNVAKVNTDNRHPTVSLKTQRQSILYESYISS